MGSCEKKASAVIFFTILACDDKGICAVRESGVARFDGRHDNKLLCPVFVNKIKSRNKICHGGERRNAGVCVVAAVAVYIYRFNVRFFDEDSGKLGVALNDKSFAHGVGFAVVFPACKAVTFFGIFADGKNYAVVTLGGHFGYHLCAVDEGYVVKFAFEGIFKVNFHELVVCAHGNVVVSVAVKTDLNSAGKGEITRVVGSYFKSEECADSSLVVGFFKNGDGFSVCYLNEIFHAFC